MKLPLALAALALASSADAALLKFNINGTYVNGTAYGATFFIDESPTVDPANAELDGYFFLTDIGFSNSPSGVAAIQFFSGDANSGGGILIVDNADFSSILFDATDLKQYYEGSEFAPHFVTGTYADLIGLGNSRDSGNFTLTISAVPGAVPEPASWALMIGGFALAGGMTRRFNKTLKIFAKFG